MRIPQPITPTKIKAQRPNGKRQALCDGGARGLYLVTHVSGRQTWELRYVSPRTGKQSSVTIGIWPVMTIAEARRVAEEQRTTLIKGEDPAIEKRRQKLEETATLEALARAWDVSSERSEADDHTRDTAMRRLERFVFPRLGARALKSLVQSDLTSVLDPIVKLGQADSANRVVTVLSQIYRFAIARGDVEVDIVARVKPNYPKASGGHHAAILDPQAFGGLLRAIDEYQSFVVRRALQLIALTFVRSGELRGAQWPEMKLEGKEPTWTVPAERMKREENGAHVVPLSRQAVQLLKEVRQLSGRGALVFPGLRHGKPLSDATMNAALTTLGYPGDVHRVHGFRSSASTMLNAMAAAEGYARWNPETIEEALAHRTTDAIRAAYNRGNQLALRRTMMQAWADECDRMRTLGLERSDPRRDS